MEEKLTGEDLEKVYEVLKRRALKICARATACDGFKRLPCSCRLAIRFRSAQNCKFYRYVSTAAGDVGVREMLMSNDEMLTSNGVSVEKAVRKILEMSKSRDIFIRSLDSSAVLVFKGETLENLLVEHDLDVQKFDSLKCKNLKTRFA